MTGRQIQLVRRLHLDAPEISGASSYSFPLAMDVDALGWNRADCALMLRLYENTFAGAGGTIEFRVINAVRAVDEPRSTVANMTPIATISVTPGMNDDLLFDPIASGAGEVIAPTVGVLVVFTAAGAALSGGIDFSLDVIDRSE